ncbi:unnamed protein product [Protopolystoma xenopodis]|uniref:Uncharacterized protein n=1 Tax=Protopolystoma xenopodis TaxID=117903 RepID=A0A3S5A5P4_9PLAT|nr:unnamed protein product [Protopolystoma xenopodis]
MFWLRGGTESPFRKLLRRSADALTGELSSGEVYYSEEATCDEDLGRSALTDDEPRRQDRVTLRVRSNAYKLGCHVRKSKQPESTEKGDKCLIFRIRSSLQPFIKRDPRTWFKVALVHTKRTYSSPHFLCIVQFFLLQLKTFGGDEMEGVLVQSPRGGLGRLMRVKYKPQRPTGLSLSRQQIAQTYTRMHQHTWQPCSRTGSYHRHGSTGQRAKNTFMSSCCVNCEPHRPTRVFSATASNANACTRLLGHV